MYLSYVAYVHVCVTITINLLILPNPSPTESASNQIKRGVPKLYAQNPVRPRELTRTYEKLLSYSAMTSST